MIHEFKLIFNEYKHPSLSIVKSINISNHLTRTDEIVKFMNKYYKLNKCTQEYVYLLCFNTNQDLLGLFQISHGNNEKAIISSKEIIISSLLTGSDRIILIHNHPNGNVTPSVDDINITNSLKFEVKILDIELLEHIIIGDKTWTIINNI